MSRDSHAYEFADAILETVGLPLLALDGDLRVEVANDAFLRHFQVTRGETLGHRLYDLGNGQWNIPELRRLLEEILPRETMIESYRVEHEFEDIGRRIMLLNAKRIDHGENGRESILLAISDVTERETLRAELEGRVEFAEKLIDSTREGLLVLNRNLTVHSANQAFYEMFRVDEDDTIGQHVLDLGNGQWRNSELRRLLEDILPSQATFDDFRVEHEFESIGHRVMMLNARRLDHLDFILLAIRDVTNQLELEEARRCRENRQSFLLKLSDSLRPLTDPEAIKEAAAEVLGRELQVSRAAYYEIEDDHYAIPTNFTDGVPPLTGRYPVDDYGSNLLQLQSRSEPIVVPDVAKTHTAEEVERLAAVGIGAYVGVTLVKNGRFIAGLAVQSRTPRSWTTAEVRLVEEVAERTWAAVERARAEEALRKSERHYRLLFDSIDQGFCVIELILDEAGKATDYRFIEVNAAFARQTGMQDAVGRTMRSFEPDLEEHWFETYGRIARTRRPERFERAAEKMGRYYEVYAFPFGAPEQNRLGILFNDIRERKEAVSRLVAAHDTFRRLVENSPFGIYVVDADFRLVQVSTGARRTFENVRPLIGRHLAEVFRILWPEPFACEAFARFRHTLETGEPYHSPGTVERRADIGRTEAYDWQIERIMLPDGRPGVVCHFYDLSERQRYEEQIRLLMREVNHRSKNLLNLIQIIARTTAGAADTGFLKAFEEQLRSLIASQDLLVNRNWQGVEIEELVRSQLAHFHDLLDTRILVRGPKVLLTPEASQALGMALHELSTNAGKYGALSGDQGRVEIRWALASGSDGARRLRMLWQETGGPPVLRTAHRGFGSKVMVDLVRMNLDAEVELQHGPSGIVWRMECPADHCLTGQAMAESPGPAGVDEAEVAAEKEAAVAATPDVRGKARVLIVEDESLLAIAFAEVLGDAGYEVVGPAATAEQALSLIERDPCDVALLDVTLRRSTSEAVARRLAEKGTPFLAITGYSRDQLPAAFAGADVISKPVSLDRLLAEVAGSLARAPRPVS